MIQVTKFKVESLDLDHLDLFWEIGALPPGPRSETAQHQIFDYEFYVLRSGDSPMGPYEQIAGPLRDQYMLRDNTVSLLHKWRQYFYKLRVVHKPTGEVKEFGPASHGSFEPDLIAADIIRQEDVLFREFVGRKCWLFIARTFGARCSCWDPILGRRTMSNHSPCFDTGFLGGYMAPIEVYVQIDPQGRNTQASSLGETQPGDTGGRMISFPPVSPRDVLVESDNARWRVISVSTTERLRSPVHQELRLHEIPRGDVEFNLPINVDLQTLTAASERNFKSPSNLKADGDYADIISFWGKPRGVLR